MTTSSEISAESGLLNGPEIGAAALGSALIGLGPRGRGGALVRVAGIALLGYAVHRLIPARIREKGAERRHIEAKGAVDIDRPIPEVFSFFKDFESFPRIASGLHSVTDYQNGLSHWEIYLPSGAVAQVDVVVTKYVPNSVIGWESVPRSDIEMRGVVRFTPVGPHGTHVDLEASYRPAHTGLGQALLALLNRRHGPTITDFLDRLRFYLESLPRGAESDPALRSG